MCILSCFSHCLTLCNAIDCSPPGSSVLGIFQARILSGLPFPSPGDLPDTGIKPTSLTSPSLALADRLFTTRTTWEALTKATSLLRWPRKIATEGFILMGLFRLREALLWKEKCSPLDKLVTCSETPWDSCLYFSLSMLGPLTSGESVLLFLSICYT